MTDEEMIRQLRKVGTTNGHDNSIVAIAADRLEALTAALPHMGGVSGLTVSAAIKDALRELDNVTAISDEDANCLGCAENLLRQALDALSPAPVGVTDEVAKNSWRSNDDIATELMDAASDADAEGRIADARFMRIAASRLEALASHEPAPEPAKDGPEVVERLRKWCSETINQWSDEYEPRENWERQVSGAMREWDKATTEIISDYEALRAVAKAECLAFKALREGDKMRADKAEARIAELEELLNNTLAAGLPDEVATPIRTALEQSNE